MRKGRRPRPWSQKGSPAKRTGQTLRVAAQYSQKRSKNNGLFGFWLAVFRAGGRLNCSFRGGDRPPARLRQSGHNGLIRLSLTASEQFHPLILRSGVFAASRGMQAHLGPHGSGHRFAAPHHEGCDAVVLAPATCGGAPAFSAADAAAGASAGRKSTPGTAGGARA